MSFKRFACVTLLCVTSLWLGFAQTKEEQLQKILKLLDQELAQRESQQKTQSDELSEAVTTIHGLGITKYDKPATYMPDNNIRRDEAATMFYRFADKVGKLGPVSNNNCNFPDLSQAHSDLVDVITNSCKYGLFKWSNGRFLPTSPITNAQAVTVMTRILDGQKSEQTWEHWALNYYNYMKNAWYTLGLPAGSTSSLDSNITRGDIAIILARVYKQVK